MTSIGRKLTKCRVCGSRDLISYLNFGNMPIANRLCNAQHCAMVAPRYPVEVLLCSQCYLSQLSYILAPTELYEDYTYRSGLSDEWKDSCRTIMAGIWVDHDTKWLDIGCNDGTMLEVLNNCQKVLGMGIDPDQACIDIIISKGFSGIKGVFDHAMAKQLIESGYKPDVISAQNVIAHVDDLDDFLAGIALLQPGYFVIEIPWAYHTIRENQWDQIYHEHLSYFLAGPLDRILARHGLWPIRAVEIPVHGGSLRITCSTRDAGNALGPFIDKEKAGGLYDINTYAVFGRYALKDAGDLRAYIKEKYYYKNHMVDAIGAAAKGCVRLNLARLDHLTVRCIVDDTPSKRGKYQPGTGIPILARDDYVTRYGTNSDCIMILPWNHNDEIRKRYASLTEHFMLVNPPRLVSAKAMPVRV